ncbi:MAG: Ig-like domain-containing protein [Nitrosomonas sp.]|nr:Ig-like domain-containing protein [Nitrosomonas sp.]
MQILERHHKQCKNESFSSKTIVKYVFLLLLVGVLEFPLAHADEAIVYTRCERTTTEFDLTANVTINGQAQTVTRRMTGLDVYDVLPDVTNFLTNFSAPCDLIYRDPSGVETIIFDCSSGSTQNSSCAALDPTVSFDGKTIAFTVFRGSLFNYRENIHSQVLHPEADPVNLGWIELPNKRLATEGAHLHFYNISTGALVGMPYQAGIYDSGPAFISNERIAFTSTRDEHTTTVVWGSTASKLGTRIWTVDVDGKNPDLASHHSLSQEQHPFMLKDGRLAYSSWQIFGGLPFRYGNGKVGGFTTIDNLFHIYAQDPDGAGNFPIYGQHSGDHHPSYFGVDHKASHFITQTSDDRIWFADYYRGNNNGLGSLVGVMPEPKGQEGIGPHEATTHADIFVPRDGINFASWAHSYDKSSHPMGSLGGQIVNHPNYTDPLPFAGKLGHPAALPSNGLMMAWGKGSCSTVTSNQVFSELGMVAPPLTNGSGSGVAMNLITSLGLDTPGCDVGLYRATRIPSQHPSDLELIVDSPDWHEIMGRAVVPYFVIHGVDRPAVIERADVRTTHASLETGTPFGLLGAASVTDRETDPRDGIHFAGEHQFNLQGTDTIDYTDDDLCGVRILGVMPNRSRNTVKDIANITGERVSILGEFPVLNRSTDGSRIIDQSGHPDTSFLVRMPANMPYLMQGVDCDGRTLNTDQTWQSLRPGEQKTCNGCHVHSRPARTQFETTFAATSAYSIPRLGEGTVPLLAGKSGNAVQTRTVPGYGMRIEFTKDIKPIFDQHCISCHGGSAPAAGLALDVTGGDNNTQNSTWWCLVADNSQSCVAPENQTATGKGPAGTTFRRPQLTRYIRAFNSRGSLLYWKAANHRTDNRSDAQYADDIDFGGTPHPTTISAQELGLLSRWIDIGVPGGTQELKDTQKPTLHLASADGNGGVSRLHVGTVDLGSGINPNSLMVCILGTDGSCNNLAGAAEKHGVTVVDLGGALSDPDVEIYARVSDLAGNTTEVYRSVSWFLNNTSGVPGTGDTKAPNISITNPTGGEVSGVIPVAVSYSDNVGVVSVEYYVNGALHGKSTQEPFAYTLDTTSLADGQNTLSAIAFDAAGNQGSSGVTFTVNNGTSGGGGGTSEGVVISIVSPTSGVVSGTIPVELNYSDTAGIVSVDLYINDQRYGTDTQAPFMFNLDTATVADGDYVLTAHAFDAKGQQYISGNVAITVRNNSSSSDTQSPRIGITSPISGEVVSGIKPVTFNVFDDVGAVRVELYANGVFAGASEDAPFTINWDTTQTANGPGYIQAYAFDQAGNKGVSFKFSMIVDNNNAAPAVDAEAPVISIVSPVAGTVSGTIPVDFSYSDNVGVVSVDLYANGQLVGKNTQAPFTFTLDTNAVADGDYTLTAHAFDEAGNQGASNVVAVTVDNIPSDTQNPRIGITSPVSGEVASGIKPVTFNVFDDVGAVRVELYANGVFAGASEDAPFTINWDTTQTANGPGYIQAYAFDQAGNKGVSFKFSMIVDNNNAAPAVDAEAPVISIVSPVAGTVSGTIPVDFSYSDNVGVVSVDLYANGQLVGKNTQAPFTFTLDTNAAADGDYTLTAHAFDEAGNQGVSATVLISVNNVELDTLAPVINVFNLYDGLTLQPKEVINASATDDTGVSQMALFIDGSQVMVSQGDAISYQINRKGNGNKIKPHVVSVVASDFAGNVTTQKANVYY